MIITDGGMLRKATYIRKVNGKPLLGKSIASARMVICLWSVILSLKSIVITIG